MEEEENTAPGLMDTSKRVAHQALVVFENRIELLMVELEEERERVMYAFWLSVVVAVCGLLAGIVLSAAIAVVCWHWSPVGILLILAAIYAAAAGISFRLLARLRSDWKTLPATMEELRKDRECLEKSLS